MRQILTFSFLFFALLSFGQKEFLDFEKYEDCHIDIPIRHSRLHQERDRAIAEQLAGREIIVIKTRNNGEISKFYRGFIGIYTESDAMATYFEPTESVISFDRKYTVFLRFNSRNTYCYDAVCFDKKNGIIQEQLEMICETESITASQFYGNGILAIDNGRYDLAIKWLEAAVQKDTTFCDAWNSLGIAHKYSGDFEKSYWSFINSLAYDSTNYMSWINIYELFKFLNDTENSIKTLKHLIDNVPDNDFGYNELIKYYKENNDAKMVDEIIEKAIKNGVQIKAIEK